MIKHVGFYRRRIRTNQREKAFADVWEKENSRGPVIGHGMGILQDLFLHIPSRYFPSQFPKYCLIKITQRDALIVATIIQWLGSNVGMGFLHEALDRCGYRIIQKEKQVS